MNYRITRLVTPAASLALITLDQAKAALGIDPADTSQDAALTQQIDQVSRAVDNYCDRIFARQSYTDHYRYVYNWLASGQPLLTRQLPIAADVAGTPVVTISEDGTAVDAASFEVDVERGALYRLNGTAVASWTGTSIVADYDAGFDVIPEDVQSAAIEWLVARWKAQGRDPALRSETIPDVITQVWSSDAVSTTTSSIPSGVQDWLAPYRLWFV
jgi:Phage gp6-like head-tail connector protein